MLLSLTLIKRLIDNNKIIKPAEALILPANR